MRLSPKPPKPSAQTGIDEQELDESQLLLMSVGFEHPSHNPRLFTVPASKWKKADWKSAAKVLAQPPPARGLLANKMHQGYIDQICDRVNHAPNKGRGRPVKWHNPQQLLDLVEERRKALASEKGVPISKITYKMAAESGALQAWDNNMRKCRTKPQQIALFYSNIKSLRKLAKLRE